MLKRSNKSLDTKWASGESFFSKNSPSQRTQSRRESFKRPLKKTISLAPKNRRESVYLKRLQTDMTVIWDSPSQSRKTRNQSARSIASTTEVQTSGSSSVALKKKSPPKKKSGITAGNKKQTSSVKMKSPRISITKLEKKDESKKKSEISTVSRERTSSSVRLKSPKVSITRLEKDANNIKHLKSLKKNEESSDDADPPAINISKKMFYKIPTPPDRNRRKRESMIKMESKLSPAVIQTIIKQKQKQDRTEKDEPSFQPKPLPTRTRGRASTLTRPRQQLQPDGPESSSPDKKKVRRGRQVGRKTSTTAVMSPEKKKGPSSSRKLKPPLVETRNKASTARLKKSLITSTLPSPSKTSTKKRVERKSLQITASVKEKDKEKVRSVPTPSPPKGVISPRRTRSSKKVNKKVQIPSSATQESTKESLQDKGSFSKTPSSRRTLQKDIDTEQMKNSRIISVKSPVGVRRKKIVVQNLNLYTPKPEEPSEIIKQTLKKNIASELKALSGESDLAFTKSMTALLKTPNSGRKSTTKKTPPSRTGSGVSAHQSSLNLLSTPLSSRKSLLSSSRLRDSLQHRMDSNGKRHTPSIDEPVSSTPVKRRKIGDFTSTSLLYSSTSFTKGHTREKLTDISKNLSSDTSEFADSFTKSFDNNFSELDCSLGESNDTVDNTEKPLTKQESGERWKYCSVM